MQKIKKITVLCLSLLAAFSFAAAGCNSGTETSSVSESPANSQNSSTEKTSNENESSSEDSDDSSSSEPPEQVGPDGCVWGDWTLLEGADATCVDEGTKIRHCIYDYTHTQTEQFAARGHEYSKDNGYCVRCDEEATIPALDPTQEFTLIDTCTHTDEEIAGGECDCTYKGRGEAYNRLELAEGCYTVEIGATNDIWLSFSVQEAGQYMLYSVDGTIAKASRHDASASFIPMNGDTYIGFDARETDGNFYSYVSCSEKYFNSQWRATYRIRGVAGTHVKICFARIDGAAWEPVNQYENMYATQINGVKAPDAGSNMKKVDVAYDSEYFYSDPKNGGDGYYHLGTKESPGAIIYAAISSVPDRLLLNGKFTEIHREGSALNLNDGLTAEGNYRIRNYVSFIMNCADDDDIFKIDENTGAYATDPNKNCYENYCNSDGLYPVNQELFDFLNLYVKHSKPIDNTITIKQWRDQEDWLWLSACYYYQEITVGTEENPLVLYEGEQTLSLPAEDFFYCVLQEAGTYKLTCSDGEVFITVNAGDYAAGETTVTVTDSPIPIAFASMDAKAVTVTIEKIA